MSAKWRVLLGVLVLVMSTALGAMGAQRSVLVFLTPKWAMGAEYVQLAEALEEAGIAVIPVAEESGPYEFLEESMQGQGGRTPPGIYKLDVAMTYEDVDLTSHSALIVGPAHAHTTWLGPSNLMAQELITDALELGMPVGGVSFGAAVLVSWGYLDGRSAAMPPYYQGVVTQGTNKAYFFAEFPEVTFEDECVWIDEEDGFTPIATATYVCLGRFAREFAAIF